MFQSPPLLAAIALFACHPAAACIWDKDTLVMEKARFPGVEEIITGNFSRHSREFHEWRKAHSEKQLAEDPSLVAVYDDLAVSQHKLGDHQAAIETMFRKEKIKPGIYETYSNLGTFYIYAGDLPKSLGCLNRALAINPDAHFGREKYQKWLVEWILTGKQEPQDGASRYPVKLNGYALHVLKRQPVTERKAMTEALRGEAIQGVLGMMLFADFDNPLLLEALGDLLTAGEIEVDATHLASMAYLQATLKSKDAADTTRLADKLERSKLHLHKGENPDFMNAELAGGLAKGIKFNEKIRADEVAWIAAGKDASEEFQKKYLKP